MFFDHRFLGRNGFYWFFGTVEDRQDPLKLGRVRVRCLGLHDKNKSETKTEDLPWAQCMMPVTSASMSEVGSVSALVEGSWVVGFFIDGSDAQEPMILGSFHGIPIDRPDNQAGFNDPRTSFTGTPKKVSAVSFVADALSAVTEIIAGPYPNYTDKPDTHLLVRNDEDVTQMGVVKQKMDSREAGQVNVPIAASGTFSEPAVPYNATYPYNKAVASESGHVLEMDDTPGNERLHMFHRVGSFIEMHPDGTFVIKSLKDLYNLSHGNRYDHVEKDMALTVDKSLSISVNRDAGSGGLTVAIGGSANLDINMGGGDVAISGAGNVTVSNCNVTVTGGDVIVDGISVKNHTHFAGDLIGDGASTTPGPVTGTTGAPVP